MKRSFYVLLIFMLLFACAGRYEIVFDEDTAPDGLEEIVRGIIPPPAWLLGEWTEMFEPKIEYIFMEDGIVLESRDSDLGEHLAYTEMLDSVYIVTLDEDGAGLVYRFERSLDDLLWLTVTKAGQDIVSVSLVRKPDEPALNVPQWIQYSWTNQDETLTVTFTPDSILIIRENEERIKEVYLPADVDGTDSDENAYTFWWEIFGIRETHRFEKAPYHQLKYIRTLMEETEGPLWLHVKK